MSESRRAERAQRVQPVAPVVEVQGQVDRDARRQAAFALLKQRRDQGLPLPPLPLPWAHLAPENEKAVNDSKFPYRVPAQHVFPVLVQRRTLREIRAAHEAVARRLLREQS